MAEKIRVIQFGLGPIGRAMARLVVERSELDLIGGVDIDPSKVGRDLGEVIGLDNSLGFKVDETIGQALGQNEAEVALHATNSYFPQFRHQLLEILQAGLNIVSISEELAYPWFTHHKEGSEVDLEAKRVGKTVIATGVNPGFLMDSLPLHLTAICQQVDYINVRRVVNASLRRSSFQAKIGCGLTIEQFSYRTKENLMGHVGLIESAGMVFNTIGKKLTQFESTVEPIIADRNFKTAYRDVQVGQVMGLTQVARAYADGQEFMTLIFTASLDPGGEEDTIKITGNPNLELALKGANGDLATVAIAVNAIRRIQGSPPGLLTMRDLPILTLW